MAKKKVVKMRGTKTNGWGSKKKHRGKGSKGGAGKSGLFKHKKILVQKTEPHRLYKPGFKSLYQRKLKVRKPAINIGQLIQENPGKDIIDAIALGYGKVLGKGVVRTPVSITAMAFTPQAKEKIESAKGKALVPTDS